MTKKDKRTPSLKRSIYFFRADIGADDGGRPLSFDPRPALDVIGQLPFEDGQGRYLVNDDGNAIVVWPEVSERAIGLRFCQIRRTGLPQLEEAGQITDLELAASAGLCEPMHVVFFSDNIVGIEYNHFGPRLSRLGYYLRVKSRNAVPMVHFQPLLRGDVAGQLDRLAEIKLLALRVRPSYQDTLRQADQSLGDAFAANAQVLDDPEDVELVLRAGKDGRRSALERLLAPLKQLARRSDLRENAARFEVKGKRDDTNRVATIDLLKDQLIVQRQIVKLGERSRALDSSSAFEAIHSAHDELGDALRQAASVDG